MYFLKDESPPPLKFNESFENWRIVSMSQVQILKINVLFAKNWLNIKVLFYFKTFSIVSSCINEIHIFCFPSKLSFRFPFHSVFHSVPFSVPFSVPRFRNTPFNNSQYPGRFALVSRQDVIRWLTFVPRKDATDCLFVGPVNKGHTILGGSIGYHKGVFSREIIR